VGGAVGEILPLAVAIALSPIPIIGLVLMLGTPRASANGPAFLLTGNAGPRVAMTTNTAWASTS